MNREEEIRKATRSLFDAYTELVGVSKAKNITPSEFLALRERAEDELLSGCVIREPLRETYSAAQKEVYEEIRPTPIIMPKTEPNMEIPRENHSKSLPEERVSERNVVDFSTSTPVIEKKESKEDKAAKAIAILNAIP